MNLKKHPKDISNEDLLKTLEDPNSTEALEKPAEHSVLLFLSDFGIYPGESKISGKILYKLYHYNTDDPVHNKEFHFILRGYLKYEVGYRGDYVYYLNKSAEYLTKRLAEFLAAKHTIKKTKNPRARQHFEHFLEAHGLGQGTYNIPAQALFYFYDKWHYNNKYKTRLFYREFIGMIKIYFITKKVAGYRYMTKVNTDFIDKHREYLNIAIEWGTKYSGRKKKDITKKKRKFKKKKTKK